MCCTESADFGSGGRRNCLQMATESKRNAHFRSRAWRFPRNLLMVDFHFQRNRRKVQNEAINSLEWWSGWWSVISEPDFGTQWMKEPWCDSFLVDNSAGCAVLRILWGVWHLPCSSLFLQLTVKCQAKLDTSPHTKTVRAKSTQNPPRLFLCHKFLD